MGINGFISHARTYIHLTDITKASNIKKLLFTTSKNPSVVAAALKVSGHPGEADEAETS